MIELFTTLKERRKKPIKIKSENISYWQSDSINELVDFIRENLDDFYIDVFHVEYAKVDDIFEDEYVKRFDIELYTSQEIYDFISDNYSRVLKKYDKRIIDATYVKLLNYKFN